MTSQEVACWTNPDARDQSTATRLGRVNGSATRPEVKAAVLGSTGLSMRWAKAISKGAYDPFDCRLWDPELIFRPAVMLK